MACNPPINAQPVLPTVSHVLAQRRLNVCHATRDTSFLRTSALQPAHPPISFSEPHAILIALWAPLVFPGHRTARDAQPTALIAVTQNALRVRWAMPSLMDCATTHVQRQPTLLQQTRSVATVTQTVLTAVDLIQISAQPVLPA